MWSDKKTYRAEVLALGKCFVITHNVGTQSAMLAEQERCDQEDKNGSGENSSTQDGSGETASTLTPDCGGATTHTEVSGGETVHTEVSVRWHKSKKAVGKTYILYAP